MALDGKWELPARSLNGGCRSVTGEAEEMPSVVHEFVHKLAADQRSRPLLGADEIDCQQKNEPGENRSGKPLTQRYRGDRKCRCKCGVRHMVRLGLTRPVRVMAITKDMAKYSSP